MADSSIPWVAPSEGIIVSMCFCISLFEERNPHFIEVSALREIQCSRSSLIHSLIRVLRVPLYATGGDNGSSRSFFGIFKILGLQIEVIIHNGVDPIRVTIENKPINTYKK